MTEGSASIIINRPIADVFDAVVDITRMGDWSPECNGARWLDPATGAALGATFEGDNAATLGPITLKRWTTTSEVTAFAPNATFEFVAEDFTTWRYEFEDDDGATRVTESFRHEPYRGAQKLLYDTIARRPAAMVKGMQATLGRLKANLEGSTSP